MFMISVFSPQIAIAMCENYCHFSGEKIPENRRNVIESVIDICPLCHGFF
jgi:hypothetical protein